MAQTFKWEKTPHVLQPDEGFAAGFLSVLGKKEVKNGQDTKKKTGTVGNIMFSNHNLKPFVRIRGFSYIFAELLRLSLGSHRGIFSDDRP